MTVIRRRRSGFTLLEVLLASAIAVFLLGGLYVAFDVTLRQTQAARDSLDHATTARAVYNLIAIDLASTLNPLPPMSGADPTLAPAGPSTGSKGSSSSGSSSSGSSASGSSTSGSGTSSSSSGSTSASSSSSTSSSSSSTTSGGTTDDTQSTSTNIPFQVGLIGDDSHMTVFVSRVPTVLGDANTFFQTTDPTAAAAAAGMGSDLRRVTYWLASSGTGLCRQERPWVTADGVWNSSDPDKSDEAGDTIADEVTSAQFEYFDGTAWQTSWDGTTTGPDGVTPQGPPRAVRITMSLEIPSTQLGVPPTTRTVSQVIPIRTAPGLNTPTVNTPNGDTAGSTTTTGSTTGGGM